MIGSYCRGGQIRTDDLLLPKQARYRATLRPEKSFPRIRSTTFPPPRRDAIPGYATPRTGRKGTVKLLWFTRWNENFGKAQAFGRFRSSDWEVDLLRCTSTEASSTKEAALTAASALAERGGFEPPVQNNPYGSLANYWFKPLTHLSRDAPPRSAGRQI